MRRTLCVATWLMAVTALAACSGAMSPSPQPSTGSNTSAPTTPSASRKPSATPASSTTDSIEGSVVRFTAGTAAIDVTIGADNATTRDFLSILPLTIPFEEFNGREKIGYLPRELDVTGTPGSDPEDGDLIYFAPWGNLGFYYDAAGIDYDDRVIHIGTYTATTEQLEQLETGQVTIELIR
jgi:hypothetical protein